MGSKRNCPTLWGLPAKLGTQLGFVCLWLGKVAGTPFSELWERGGCWVE